LCAGLRYILIDEIAAFAGIVLPQVASAYAAIYPAGRNELRVKFWFIHLLIGYRRMGVKSRERKRGQPAPSVPVVSLSNQSKGHFPLDFHRQKHILNIAFTRGQKA
jgi:hypothetical protein